MSRTTFDRVLGPKRLRELTNGSHLPLEQPAVDELKAELSGFLDDVAASWQRSAPAGGFPVVGDHPSPTGLGTRAE